ncbi:MAG: metallophosphoesterase [Phycisphaerae bacterium]|nr:metallophosphoesterase [Phycisphaerae bacterium]
MPKHLARCSCRLLIGVVLALPCGHTHGQLLVLKQGAYQNAREKELKALPAEPNWAKIDEEPLFRFAWVSDLHMFNGNIELVRQAMRFVDDELTPSFLMITGDNNSIPEPPKPGGGGAAEPERQQRFFKRFLEENLKTPYVVIPGDNWPRDFETVFGAFQFSFDYGGMHFLFTSLDRDLTLGEGLGVFDAATWQWMRDDLERNRRRPTLVMLHETVAPPTFFEAEKLQHLLEENPSVIASFSGHVHLDLDVRHRGVRYLICPGFGENPRHGFKHVLVYPHALIIRTIEYNEPRRRFERVNKWQYVPIARPLRAALHRPEGTFVKDNYAEIPPHPRRFDPTLASKKAEFLAGLMRYMSSRLSGSNAKRPSTAASGQ